MQIPDRFDTHYVRRICPVIMCQMTSSFEIKYAVERRNEMKRDKYTYDEYEKRKVEKEKEKDTKELFIGSIVQFTSYTLF